MIYKAFAAVTLIAAPVIVLTVQSFAPRASHAVPTAAVAPAPAPVVMPAEAMPSPPPAPMPGAADFGQPMPEAGKPFLAPGAGLPAAPASNVTPVEDAQPSDETPR